MAICWLTPWWAVNVTASHQAVTVTGSHQAVTVTGSHHAVTVTAVLKEFFWELVMLIYGNLSCLKNWKISSDEIVELTSRFLNGCDF